MAIAGGFAVATVEKKKRSSIKTSSWDMFNRAGVYQKGESLNPFQPDNCVWRPTSTSNNILSFP